MSDAPEWASSNPRLARAWRRTFELDHPLDQLEPRLDLLQGRLFAARQRFDEARSVLEEAAAEFARVLDHDGLCLAKLSLSGVHLAVARPSEADESAREALDVATRRNLKLREADAWLALAQTSKALGKRDELMRCLDRAEAIVDETGYGRLAPAITALRSAFAPPESNTSGSIAPENEPPESQSLS